MNYLLFGCSGFIGTYLVQRLCDEVVGANDNIYILDLVKPRIDTTAKKNVFYVQTDVREKIAFDYKSTDDDVIFNLAAIHKTPGYEAHEYFNTNIKGAQNIVDFAEKHNIKKIFFTSSIAVYGASEDKKFEDSSVLMPNSAYGVSKVIAENIQEKWQLNDKNKRTLFIFRPGVVFGLGENGNFTRMINALKGNYFFYPGRKDTIKACIYVKELVNFIVYCLLSNKVPGTTTYNCTYEPAYSVENICEVIKEELHISRKTIVIPSFFLLFISYILMPFFNKKIGIHPARVRKLMTSTNISGAKMQAESKNGYKMLYDFKSAISDLI